MDTKLNSEIKLVAHETNHFKENKKTSIMDKYYDLRAKNKWFRWGSSTAKILFEILVITWIILTITFFILNAAPGKPSLASGVPDSVAQGIEHKFHLDLPISQQYWQYIGGLFQWNFGISISLFPGVEINDFIWQRFGTSLLIGIISLALTIFIGIPLGVWAGKNPGRVMDATSTILISVLISLPSMIFGILLLLIGRSVGLKYIYQGDDVSTWIIPALALALPSIVSYVRWIRTSLNEELKSQHAKYAYLKGVSKNRFIWKHALKPALFPIATYFPFVLLSSFMGALFIERIFMIPGSGFLTMDAAQSKDIYIIMFMSLISSIMTILSFYLRDWLYIILDPRLRRKA